MNKITSKFILLLILSSSSIALIGQNKDTTEREHLISMVRNFWNLQDSAAIFTMNKAAGFAESGDTTILNLMFDLVYKSDGYVSEGLGSHFGSLFLSKPEYFIKCASNRPKPNQKSIAELTFAEDGGGMRPEEFIQARNYLKKYQSFKNSKIRSSAILFLEVLENVYKELQK